MSEDPINGQRRAAVTRTGSKTESAGQRTVESAPNAVSPASRRRLIEAPLHETASLSDDVKAAMPQPKRRFALPVVLPRLMKVSSVLASFVAAAPRLKISPVLVSLVGCVVLPAFVATVYFALIASDQFTAEARFAVRQIEIDSSDSSSNSSSTSSESNRSVNSSIDFAFTAPEQNAYIVTSYIQSRAVVDDLNTKLNLRAIFRRPEADFWARLKRNASIDELTRYWKSMITTYIDGPSSIVTFQVRAFRADDAVNLANAVLGLSETLVNRISDRARRDAMEMSEKEVRRTYEMTQAALADLHTFRDSAGIIDPAQAGTEIGTLLLPLLSEKIGLESDLFVASRDLDDSAPTIRALKNRLATTEQQIADLKGKLTDKDGTSKTVAASLAKFEELDLQRQFAEKLYTLAQADLDRARLRAARQSVYLTVFVPPSLPEESLYPRRIAFPILVLIGLIIVWAIIVMTVASVEDHRL